MSTHLTLMCEALRLRRTPELFDAAIAAALIRPSHSTGHSMLMDLMGDPAVTTEQQLALLTFPHERVRHAAWHQFGPTAPISLWETAVSHETDPDVLTAMDVTAPWDALSRPTVNRLLDEPEDTTRLSSKAAQKVLRLTFRDGMQNLWREALEVINPDDAFTPGFLDMATKPVLTGDVHGLSVNAHSDFLLAQACASTAPDGAITDVLTAHPELLDPDTAPSSQLVRAWMSVVASTPVGRRRDLTTLLASGLGGVANEHIRPVLQHLPFNASAGEMMAYVLDRADESPPRFSAGDLVKNWDRLPVAERTDQLCVELLVSKVTTDELVQRVVEHLGDRASDLLTEHTLRANNRNLIGGPIPAWVRLTDQAVWVQMLRRLDAKEKLQLQLSEAKTADVTAAADDLLAHPQMWHSHTIAPLAAAAGFGPDEWARLAPTQVLAVAQDNTAAAEWLTAQLVAADLGGTTVALAADQAVNDDTTLADALSALKAFA